MENAIVYIHGKGGSADEAARYASVFRDCDVIGFDYKAQTPQQTREEFPAFFDRVIREHTSVSVLANSIGAFYAMHSLADMQITKAYFISPVVDMENLICNMMRQSDVTEDKLRSEGEIVTFFGETLSWGYLSYVRENPISWHIPTHILYGGKDELTPPDIMTGFAEGIGASLTVMDDGEHWFHTEEQMRFLVNWLLRTV